MKKIPTLFVRDMTTKLITPEVTPGCEWVIEGKGVATEKMDGTCCMVRGGKLYKRYDAKAGRTPPEGFEPAQAAPDLFTLHWPGWLLVGDGPDDKWHREAWADNPSGYVPPDWTYELVGPKLQGNPYALEQHKLWMHGCARLADAPRSFDALRGWLEQSKMEGLVFWRDFDDPNCDKCKVKRRDFNLPWPVAL